MDVGLWISVMAAVLTLVVVFLTGALKQISDLRVELAQIKARELRYIAALDERLLEVRGMIATNANLHNQIVTTRRHTIAPEFCGCPQCVEVLAKREEKITQEVFDKVSSGPIVHDKECNCTECLERAKENFDWHAGRPIDEILREIYDEKGDE